MTAAHWRGPRYLSQLTVANRDQSLWGGVRAGQGTHPQLYPASTRFHKHAHPHTYSSTTVKGGVCKTGETNFDFDHKAHGVSPNATAIQINGNGTGANIDYLLSRWP